MPKGLSTAEAQARLKKHGYNELTSSGTKSLWKLVIEVIKEPMFLLLISCGVLYMILGDYKEGIILISSISIIILITFIQHRKTEKALEALKNLSSPRALVVRDGTEKRIPGREVVPDDVVILNEGDRIPADGFLSEAVNLEVDESILTGESVPVIKSISDPTNKLFSGTLVTKGRGLLTVEKTGQSTEFGKIGTSLENIKEEVTPLQKEMASLIKMLGVIGVILCISIVFVFYFTRGNFIHSLLNGLSSAMAILPEEFPVVLTVFLALGAWRLSKVNVLTRKPSAIETLGSTTVLCSDKTGTITQNKMMVGALHTGHSRIEQDHFQTETEAHKILETAFLATHPGSIDPMEKALINSFESHQLVEPSVQLIKEYPFSHELLASTRLYQIGNEKIAYCKGAPETVFQMCRIADDILEGLTGHMNQLAKDGYRVIAVASAKVATPDLPLEQQSISFDFTGLIGLVDPIRPEVKQAISECRDAGIRVIMITGDFPETARNIGKQIGLDQGDVLTGSDLNNLSDKELSEVIKDVSIIARVIPDQKLRIVEALKNDKEIVAMTGDGVNDAPALKAAHIGIAMGNKGTDVAREASSLVLLDDNFASIVGAIRMGRKIFDNLQKAMSYILAVHIPIIALTLLPAFINDMVVLLMPLHIVFLELIIDPISSVAFESEEEEKEIMMRPPRDMSRKFFGQRKILISLAHGLLLFITVLFVLFFSRFERHSEEEIRAIAFATLILCNLLLVLSKLSQTRSFIKVLSGKNHPAKIILFAAFCFLLILIFVPPMSRLFNLSNPGITHFWITLVGSFGMLAILELIKLFTIKKK